MSEAYKSNTLTWKNGRELATYGNYSFTYDANGIRIGKTNGTTVTNYIVDGSTVLRQSWTSGSNSYVADYIYSEAGLPLAFALSTNGGEYVVLELVQHELLELPVTVYNFEVEDFHTYYVINKEILVHNKCDVVKENGVTIKSLYPQDHGNPAHLHVFGGGKATKIGPQGLPVKGYPSLTDKQTAVVKNNLATIKKAIKEAQKYLRTLG